MCLNTRFFFVNKEAGLERVQEHSDYTKLSIFQCLISSQDSIEINMVVFFFFNHKKYKFFKHKRCKVFLKYFLTMLSAKLVSERKLLTLSKHLTWPTIATYFYMMLWDVLENGLFRFWETIALFPEKLKNKKLYLSSRSWLIEHGNRGTSFWASLIFNKWSNSIYLHPSLVRWSL